MMVVIILRDPGLTQKVLLGGVGKCIYRNFL